MSKRDFKFDTLKDCLQFLEWCRSGGGRKKIPVLAAELYGRIQSYYDPKKCISHEIEKSLSKFLETVHAFYHRLCHNPDAGSYNGKNENHITDALLECIPKFISAMYYLWYCINNTFSAVGGGGWQSDWPGWKGYTGYKAPWYDEWGGDLDKYLHAASTESKYGVIPGGFEFGDVKYYKYDGYYRGYSMANDLENILKKYSNKYNFFRDILATSVFSDAGAHKVNTGNAVALVGTFCEIVETDPGGKTYLRYVQKDKTCLDWKKLKDHCSQLKKKFRRFFTDKRFSHTGQSPELKSLKQTEFAKKTATWLRENLADVKKNLEKIITDNSALQNLGEYFTKSLFPYGFIFGDKRHGMTQREVQVLKKDWLHVIGEFRKQGDGLEKLKEILEGDTCPMETVPETQPSPKKPEVPPVKVPEVPKKVAVPKKPEAPPVSSSGGNQNQSKKADGTPNQPTQNNGQSKGKYKGTSGKGAVSPSTPNVGIGAGQTRHESDRNHQGHQDPGSSAVFSTQHPQVISPPASSPGHPAPTGPAGPPTGKPPGTQNGNPTRPQPAVPPPPAQIHPPPSVPRPDIPSSSASAPGGGSGPGGQVSSTGTTQHGVQGTPQSSSTAATTTSNGSSGGGVGGENGKKGGPPGRTLSPIKPNPCPAGKMMSLWPGGNEICVTDAALQEQQLLDKKLDDTRKQEEQFKQMVSVSPSFINGKTIDEVQNIPVSVGHHLYTSNPVVGTVLSQDSPRKKIMQAQYEAARRNLNEYQNYKAQTEQRKLLQVAKDWIHKPKDEEAEWKGLKQKAHLNDIKSQTDSSMVKSGPVSGTPIKYAYNSSPSQLIGRVVTEDLGAKNMWKQRSDAQMLEVQQKRLMKHIQGDNIFGFGIHNKERTPFVQREPSTSHGNVIKDTSRNDPSYEQLYVKGGNTVGANIQREWNKQDEMVNKLRKHYNDLMTLQADNFQISHPLPPTEPIRKFDVFIDVPQRSSTDPLSVDNPYEELYSNIDDILTNELKRSEYKYDDDKGWSGVPQTNFDLNFAPERIGLEDYEDPGMPRDSPRKADERVINPFSTDECQNPWYVTTSSTDTLPPPTSALPDSDHLPPPKTVREMLHWFVGLSQLGYIGFITDYVKRVILESNKDVSKLSDDLEVTGHLFTLTASHVAAKLTETCLYSATIIYKIRHNNDFKAFATFNFESVYSQLRYSPDPACLLCQLRDYAYACCHQLEFLKSQCKRDKLSSGWQSHEYGSDLKTPSPLQAFLTDGWDSAFETHLFDPCNLCHKSRIRMGFRMEDLPKTSQLGSVISTILTPSCGGDDPLLTLSSYLNCLTRRTPRTTGELVSCFHHFGNELHGYAFDSLSPLGSSLTKAHLNCPDWDHLGRHDLGAVRGIRGTESIDSISNDNHDKKHPRTLSTLVGCSGDTANCQPHCSPITYRAYALYSQSFAHTYLSWTVYLPDRLWESLLKLYYDLLKHLGSGKCSSLHLCSTALPLLYLHGFTPPEVKSQAPLKCSDVMTKLEEIVNGGPIASLMTCMDAFLYGIREPFIFTLVALWSTAFLIFANTMLYRLDVLYIRSHLIRTKASHRIDVKALLTKGRKMLSLYKDVDYFDEDPIGLLGV